ncbi:GDP-mannose transporter into the lumen of the Golgi [Tieghemiomyces parasiticus]|uniref:GDP-mannose transporter into the lumen of the Golgi n=1 Tax=Tieghemiomyces parasiticus TaxID=78921 RepID=A0A9W8E346_9FUNG|nr:GDP-mannose transporter into the lumen of the Golgi [Tieghemiomyces parasiticus]
MASITAFASAVPILAYCLSSITMTMVNKFVLSGFQHHMVFLMLGIQALSSVVLLVVSSKFLNLQYRSMSMADARAWLPVSVTQAVMLYTGGKSLQYLNVPLFTIFKNLTIILVAYGERLMFKSIVTPLMMAAFGLMVLSSIVGGWNDIQFNLLGYMWMAMNCFSSAFFVLHMRRVMKVVNFKDFDTVYYNNLLTAPMFFVLSIVVENWGEFLAYYDATEHRAEYWSFVRSNLFSGICAFAISYCTAWCIRTTSSTTYSMAGALNKLPIAVFAMFYFDDPVTAGGVLAVALGFSAGLVYTHAKNLQKKDSASQANLPTPISMEPVKNINVRVKNDH